MNHQFPPHPRSTGSPVPLVHQVVFHPQYKTTNRDEMITAPMIFPQVTYKIAMASIVESMTCGKLKLKGWLVDFSIPASKGKILKFASEVEDFLLAPTCSIDVTRGRAGSVVDSCYSTGQLPQIKLYSIACPGSVRK